MMADESEKMLVCSDTFLRNRKVLLCSEELRRICIANSLGSAAAGGTILLEDV